MALPTASDNVFPKLILSEQTEPATPSTGEMKMFLDVADGLFKWKNDAGTVFSIGTAPADIVDYPTAETDTSLVLAPDGAGGVEFRAETGGGGGALVLLEQHTASTSASLDFTAWYSATYDEYQIEILNLKPATDNVYAYMRMSTDGGSSYDSGTNYDSAGNYAYTAGTGVTGATGNSLSAMRLCDSLGNAGNYGFGATMRLFEPASTSRYKLVIGHGHFYHYSVPGLFTTYSSHAYKSTTAVNAFQFLMSSGNIASGIIRVYGVAKS